MGFFDNLGKNIQEKGKAVAKATKDMTEVMSLKSQISSEKSNIQTNYQKLGEIAYTNNWDVAEDVYGPLFEVIKASKDKIASLENDIQRIEGSSYCANCGAKLPTGANACPQCGTFVAGRGPAAPQEACAAEDAPAEEAVVTETPAEEAVATEEAPATETLAEEAAASTEENSNEN